MKIAIVQRRMDRLGGAERLVHDLARGLAAKGHQVDFFVYKYNEDYWGRIADQKYRVCFLKLFLVPRPLRIPVMGLYFRFKLRGYDIINIHNTYIPHWMIVAAAFNRPYPPVLWYCNEPRRETYYDVLEPDQAALWKSKGLEKYTFTALGRLRVAWQIWSYRLLDKLAVRRCRAVLANSHYAGRLIRKAFNIRPVICHAGVSPAISDPTPVFPKPYFLLVSRMVFHKNVDMVLRALAALKKRGGLGMKLVLAGSGQDLERLKALAIELGLQENTDFLGFVNDRKLENLYANAEFFIYIPIHEPFGLTLVEAMKHGIPAIGAADGGAAEIVDHEVNGLLVDPQDRAAVESAIERMLSGAKFRHSLGIEAKNKAEQYFSLDKFTARFEDICSAHVKPGPGKGQT
jgi:glycosyltransferase involved in cell wall biosynthesis